MAKVIGLLGRARAGKDTVAGIVQAMDPRFRVVRLAAPVKAAAAALTGWAPNRFEDASKEAADAQEGVSPRDVMVHLTHSTMAWLGDDFFTRRFWRDYDAGLHGARVLLPDVRYARDVAWIRARGGVVLKIVRPVGGTTYAHEDAIDALAGDATVLNDGDPEVLAARVRDLVQKWI